jgi:hypothetical protein
MRTLIDLLNNDAGYARIFAEAEGFGYELTTYRPRVIPDLFERMSGYGSLGDALAAANQQLASLESSLLNGPKRRRKR